METLTVRGISLTHLRGLVSEREQWLLMIQLIDRIQEAIESKKKLIASLKSATGRENRERDIKVARTKLSLFKFLLENRKERIKEVEDRIWVLITRDPSKIAIRCPDFESVEVLKYVNEQLGLKICVYIPPSVGEDLGILLESRSKVRGLKVMPWSPVETQLHADVPTLPWPQNISPPKRKRDRITEHWRTSKMD